MTVNKINNTLDFVDIELLEPGIVRSTYKNNVHLDFEKSQQVHNVMLEVTEGKPHLHLFIACVGLEVDKETREWGVTEEANKYLIASAIVCDALAHRILGNFFIKVQKPVRPTKMFSNQEDALVWLKSFNVTT